MSDKILVIGATGKVGLALTTLLSEKGLPVRAGVRDRAKAAQLGLNDIELVDFDYTKPETIEPAFQGVGHAFFQSPPGDPNSPRLLAPAIEAAKRAGVEHIVNLAAKGVELDASIPLRVVEKRIEESGLGYTLLRPTWFMQNCNGFLLDSIRQGGSIYLPAADAKTAFIDTRDIAAVATKALTEPGHQGKAYSLTGGESLTYEDVAVILSEAASKPISYIALSEQDARAGMQKEGWPAESVEFMLGLFARVREGYAEEVTSDVREVLGREPILFEQYARDYAEIWQ